MNFDLMMGLLKVALEVFKDERRDRFQKKYLKLKDAWLEEMSKGIDYRSDLALDSIVQQCRDLAQLVINEASRK